MWPKMLFEVLPHLARLIPMADKFFANRSASEKAQEAALATLALGVRGDLGQVTEAHAGLARQMQEQGAALGILISAASDEAKHARIAVESVEARMTRLENTAATATRLAAIALMMLAVVLILLAIMLTKLHGR